MKFNSLKQPDDKLYLPLQENLDLLATVPIPKDDENNSGPETHNQDENVNVDLDNRIIQLDYEPADNGGRKNQDDWIAFWNNVADGRFFASMPDYYRAFKQLKDKFEHGSPEEEKLVKIVINSLRDDFDWVNKENCLVSSTRIIYQPDKSDARIIHHYNSNNKLIIEEKEIIIPDYSATRITEVLDDVTGLFYLRTLFGTKDDKEVIMQTLEFISDINRNNIGICTPPLIHTDIFNRKEKLERASVLYYYTSGLFRVDCAEYSGSCRSRSVRIIPPENTQNNEGAK